VNSTATLYFRNYYYYGSSSVTEGYSSSFITYSVGHATLATTKARSLTYVISGEEKYMFYAYP